MARPSVVDDIRLFLSGLPDVLSRRFPSVYVLRPLLLAAALSAFLAGYLLVLAGSLAAVGWLTVRLVEGGFTLVGGLGLVAATIVAGLLSVVFARGLFRQSSFDHEECVEVTADDEPEFFAFIEDLCDRTEAPFPDRVYVCPQVNAGVFVRSSLLEFIRPTERHLLVGLGMVEALNRTELEAVLAHEFGHFSQRSMRLHDWARTLTGVVDEIIHGRDALDTALARWQRSSIPDFGIATLLVGANTGLRRGCEAIRSTIDRLESAVSHQMELEADDVAVELTGSDAIIHALVRTDWADRCHSQTLYDLEQATSHGIRTRDLYFHQSELAETMRRRLDDPDRGRPPRLPDDPDCFVPVFMDEAPDVDRAETWESHPAHRVREQHARRPYRRTDFDDRSAWSLFENPKQLRQAVTDRVYDARWEVDAELERRPARQLQPFLDGEHAEILLTETDRTVYAHRFIEPGSLREAVDAAENCDWSRRQLADRLQRLTGPELREARRRVERNLEPAAPASTGPSATRSLREPSSPSGPGDPSSEPTPTPEEDRKWLADWDRRLLIAMLAAAHRRGPDAVDNLVTRYEFHLHLQDILGWLREHVPMVQSAIAALGDGDVTDDEMELLVSTLRPLHAGLDRGLSGAPPVPPLHGLSPGTALSTLATDEPLLDSAPLEAGTVDPDWLASFADQWEQVLERLGHLRWKSLGALLLYQRQLQSELT